MRGLNFVKTIKGKLIMTQYFNVNSAVHELPDGINPADYIKQAYTVITLAAANLLRAPPIQTLAEAKAAQIANINQSAETEFMAIKASYPKSEVDTWSLQFDEATAFTANALSPTPTLDGIVLTSGLTKAVVVASVLTKAALFQTAAGKIIGKRKSLTAQINAATTNAGVGIILW